MSLPSLEPISFVMDENARPGSLRSQQTPPPLRTQSELNINPINAKLHRLDIYQVEGEKIPLGNLSLNRDNHIQVAPTQSERLSAQGFHDQENAWAEILPPTISPSRAIIGNRDSAIEQWVRLTEVTRTGLLNLRILSDAFFFKCGYRDSRDVVISDEEQKNWKKRSQPNGPKGKCVFGISEQLEREAGLTKMDLRDILQQRAFRGTIRDLDGTTNSTTPMARKGQNAAAHEQAIGVVAHHLLRYFRVNPHEEAQLRTEAMFRWVTGLGMKRASAEHDARILTRETILPPEIQPFTNGILDEEEMEYIRAGMA